MSKLSNRPLRILTADTLTTDYIVPQKQVRGLVYDLQCEGRMMPDSKMQIDRRTYDAFKLAVGDNYESKSPGGSSFNTTTTLSRLLHRKIDVTFLGVLGIDEDSIEIRESMEKDNLTRPPLVDSEDYNVTPQAATSFAVMFPNRHRAIASYPGTAKDYLPKVINEDMVKNSDVIFLQGSLWQKLEETFPVKDGHAPEDKLGFADKMLRYRWKHDKELWFALPTQEQYSNNVKNVRTHEEKALAFRDVMAESNVVLGNAEELARAYTNDEEYKAIKSILSLRKITPEDLKKDEEKNPDPVGRLIEQGRLSKEEAARFDFPNQSVVAETAFARMHEAFAAEPLVAAAATDSKHFAKRWEGKTEQVGFITCGKDGMVVITKDGIERFGPPSIEKGEIKNTIGAGDTAFAGFLYGYINNQPHAVSAQIATELAGAKLRHNGPTLPDPKAVLGNRFPIVEPVAAGHSDGVRL